MTRRLIVFTVVLSLTMIGSNLRAQQTAPATKSTPAAQAKPAADLAKMPLVGVTVVQIKPELVNDWLEFQKAETIPTLQKGGIKQRTGLTTAVGQSFEYVFLTPMANLAERDGDSPIVKALGQEGARAYAQKNRKFMASQRTHIVRFRTDLTYQPDPAAQLPLAVVSDYSLVAGRTADFENYIRTDLTPAHKQLKTGGFLVYQELFGGDGNAFVIATPVRAFADLDQGPAIQRAYGQARAAAIQQKLNGIVAHVERTLSRMVPELTFTSRAMSNEK